MFDAAQPMFFINITSVVVLLTLSKRHNQQLKRLYIKIIFFFEKVTLLNYADSSSKCTSSEFNLGIEKHLMRRSVFQRFSRSMIESVHDEVNLIM